MRIEHTQAARAEMSHARLRLNDFIASRERGDTQGGVSSWKDFLAACDRVFNRLLQGAARSSAATWGAELDRQRSNDELLCYFWKARNANEHVLAGSVVGLEWPVVNLGGLLVGFGGGPRGPKMTPVTDRNGTVYPVPMSHLGAPIGPTPGRGLSHRATLMLGYLERAIREAEQFVPPSSSPNTAA